jgi:hypothetical protein
MKYVDWVERVLRAVVDAFDAGDGFAAGIGAIRRELGVDLDERAEPLWDALRDLERLGLIDTSNGHFVKIDQEARKIRVAPLRRSWGRIHEVWLEEDQERFLTKLCEMSERREDEWAYLEEVQGDAVLEARGEQPQRGDAYKYIEALADLGMVDGSRMTMGSFPTFPTYTGLVRATEKVATEGQALVQALLDDWETTNTDFKRELHLATKDDKAEFVRDALALANTQVTGDRYLVTGFDPKSHEFTTTADPSVTQDRIEDVLNEYTEPPVTVRYVTFPWTDDSGEAGLLEIKRDRTKVPYRVRRSLRGAKNAIDVREVFVRHGSHIAVASSEEVKDLEDEAARARQG